MKRVKMKVLKEFAIREVIKDLLKNPSKKNLDRLRLEYAREYHHILSNPEILSFCTTEEKNRLGVLRKKPVRSLSGISVVAVMYPGMKCPGICLYCPTSKIAPKSYTGYEPATRRARQQKFDPYGQVKARLRQLSETGHPVSKIELIVMGGTFLSEPEKYQEDFVKRCFDGLNGKDSKDINDAQKSNEVAEKRCVGLTFETRPDYCRPKQIKFMRRLGGTRVELGVQSIYDDILEKVQRGHPVKETIRATRDLKEAGFKVLYHIMPGLPGSDPEKDVEMFREIFENPDFRPDMMKIYPCLVVKGSELYKEWKKGEYKPYTTEEAVEVIAKATKHFPKYVRIMRMQRDIPVKYISAGVKLSNLTELVNQRLSSMRKKCSCIRCREVGHQKRRKYDFRFEKIEYDASGGKEIFLSYEDKDVLAAYLRLRHGKKAIVRELRVLGQEIPVGKRGGYQHSGLGKKLLAKAEELSSGYNSISVISAVGTRQYYQRFGYRLKNHYMVKAI